MSSYVEAPAKAEQSHLRKVSTLTRFVLIGVILAAIAGTFAWLGGWLTPNELTPARFVDGLEEVNGIHPGFRRNHARGVGTAGFFESNGKGVRLSAAFVFQPGRVPVLGRFSLGGGQPDAPDAPGAVRGLGLQFSLSDGELWRTAMVNLPVFPVRTAEGFYDQAFASKPAPQTGKPDPALMKAFLARHPETEQALKVIKAQPPSSGFGNSTFHSLNAFRFTNAAGASIPVRWILTPEQSFEAASPASTPPASTTKNKNYLFDALIVQIHLQPLHWHLIVIVGQPGDPTNDATIPWPADREQVDVGTLTLDHVESDDTSAARDINFDPLVLPVGIAPSDDPLLSPRSAVYSQSFSRREREPKEPSPVTPAEVRKDEGE
jgi:catalase